MSLSSVLCVGNDIASTCQLSKSAAIHLNNVLFNPDLNMNFKQFPS